MVLKLIIILLTLAAAAVGLAFFVTKSPTTLLLYIEFFGFIVFPITVLTAALTANTVVLLGCLFVALVSAGELVLLGLVITLR